MRKEENGMIDEFESEEKEAEYWDTHSPLDLVAEPKLRKVRVSAVKERPITIRLDSVRRARLNQLAAKSGLGPSTFARLVLTRAIENMGV